VIAAGAAQELDVGPAFIREDPPAVDLLLVDPAGPMDKSSRTDPASILSYILSTIAAFLIFKASSLGDDQIPNAVALIVALPLIVIVAMIVRGQRRKMQGFRDAEAAAIVAAVRRNEPALFCLFLRPFAATGNLPQENPGHPAAPIDPAYFEDRAIDLEAILARWLDGAVSFIAIGKSTEVAGAGRVGHHEEGVARRYRPTC
jgi:hypothetical protein